MLFVIRLLYNQEVGFIDVDGMNLKRTNHVIVKTQNGPEIARVLGEVHHNHDGVNLLRFLRLCSQDDFQRMHDNKAREKEAFDVALEKIHDHDLDMKLVSVHFFLDGNKILFNFTADERVDFRDLVKDLASVFKKRIELHQIGARDEAKIVEGIGVCGRPFCCSAVKNELQPVTIKMAKDQNLILNSSKISGACGRLLCCLAYEHDQYCEIKRQYPAEGTIIEYSGKRVFLEEINIIKRIATIKSDDGVRTIIPLEKLPTTPKEQITDKSDEQEHVVEDV